MLAPSGNARPTVEHTILTEWSLAGFSAYRRKADLIAPSTGGTVADPCRVSGQLSSLSVSSCRILCSGNVRRSRLLNAITSTNFCARLAIMASRADHSIADDPPAKRLQRLYRTNHFVVSMFHPIAIFWS